MSPEHTKAYSGDFKKISSLRFLFRLCLRVQPIFLTYSILDKLEIHNLVVHELQKTHLDKT